jgi:hypothetical protein
MAAQTVSQAPTKEEMDFHDAPIKTTDAASMLRRRTRKNERPYTATVIKLNNRLVDEWKKTLLDRMADQKGMVRTIKVWQSWGIFYEGKTVQKVIELRDQGLLPKTDKKVIDYWVEFFEKSTIEDLHEYGHGTVSFGWLLLQNEIRLWCADEKWEKIYSKSDDPYEWYQESFKHPDLVQGKKLPFWDMDKLKEIEERMATVLHVQVEPTG